MGGKSLVCVIDDNFILAFSNAKGEAFYVAQKYILPITDLGHYCTEVLDY